jgi:hypothetical protein
MPSSNIFTLGDLPPKVIVDTYRVILVILLVVFPTIYVVVSRRSGNACSLLGWSTRSAAWMARWATGLACSAAVPALGLSEVKNSGVT